MKGFIGRFPAMSQFLLALAIGSCVVALVQLALIPKNLMVFGALSASIAGIILTAISSGKAGLKELFGRLKIWKVGFFWWVFAVFTVLLVVVIGMVSNTALNLDALQLGRIADGLPKVVPFLIVMCIMGGFGEELGWRGFMLPRVQSRYNALVASLIVGVLHGFWHIPMFFIEGLSPYQEMAAASSLPVVILGYTLFYITPWTILYTCLLNNTKGSLLLAVVFHGSEAWVLTSWNIENTRGYIGLAVGMTILAVVAVLVFGFKNLSRTQGRYTIGN